MLESLNSTPTNDNAIGKATHRFWRLLLAIGLFLVYGESILGTYKNPLDFHFKTGNMRIYFPLGTSLIISVAVSIIIYLFRK